jgi:hypothetical protein
VTPRRRKRRRRRRRGGGGGAHPRIPLPGLFKPFASQRSSAANSDVQWRLVSPELRLLQDVADDA